jgi:hypothetical protein
VWVVVAAADGVVNMSEDRPHLPKLSRASFFGDICDP